MAVWGLNTSNHAYMHGDVIDSCWIVIYSKLQLYKFLTFDKTLRIKFSRLSKKPQNPHNWIPQNFLASYMLFTHNAGQLINGIYHLIFSTNLQNSTFVLPLLALDLHNVVMCTLVWHGNEMRSFCIKHYNSMLDEELLLAASVS